MEATQRLTQPDDDTHTTVVQLFSSSGGGGAEDTQEGDRYLMQMTSVESIDQQITDDEPIVVQQRKVHMTMPLIDGEASHHHVRGRVSPIQVREEDKLIGEQNETRASKYGPLKTSEIGPQVIYPKAASTLATNSTKSAQKYLSQVGVFVQGNIMLPAATSILSSTYTGSSLANADKNERKHIQSLLKGLQQTYLGNGQKMRGGKAKEQGRYLSLGFQQQPASEFSETLGSLEKKQNHLVQEMRRRLGDNNLSPKSEFVKSPTNATSFLPNAFPKSNIPQLHQRPGKEPHGIQAGQYSISSNYELSMQINQEEKMKKAFKIYRTKNGKILTVGTPKGNFLTEGDFQKQSLSPSTKQLPQMYSPPTPNKFQGNRHRNQDGTFTLVQKGSQNSRDTEWGDQRHIKGGQANIKWDHATGRFHQMQEGTSELPMVHRAQNSSQVTAQKKSQSHSQGAKPQHISDNKNNSKGTTSHIKVQNQSQTHRGAPGGKLNEIRGPVLNQPAKFEWENACGNPQDDGEGSLHNFNNEIQQSNSPRRLQSSGQKVYPEALVVIGGEHQMRESFTRDQHAKGLDSVNRTTSMRQEALHLAHIAHSVDARWPPNQVQLTTEDVKHEREQLKMLNQRIPTKQVMSQNRRKDTILQNLENINGPAPIINLHRKRVSEIAPHPICEDNILLGATHSTNFSVLNYIGSTPTAGLGDTSSEGKDLPLPMPSASPVLARKQLLPALGGVVSPFGSKISGAFTEANSIAAMRLKERVAEEQQTLQSIIEQGKHMEQQMEVMKRKINVLNKRLKHNAKLVFADAGSPSSNTNNTQKTKQVSFRLPSSGDTSSQNQIEQYNNKQAESSKDQL
ncbi:hypothetical protein FGO68_gene11424 [Halteria grandinella]|uniref:Uncharacterized protein n=1 Tax=Halteria grandinella TaxID=5974 RepID=A0A8J8TAL2_HALGN|nr:hypothetical protein FGO68_gene11424 [Halteria grandinella]